jgi:microcystin-dependent protein
MSQPYLGEIRMFGFNFAPRGWMLCNGQTLAISQYAALFSLLGTTYGGNGTSTFQLPNLQSRVPVHQGTGAGLSPYVMGEATGTENVTLLTANMPMHSHVVNAVTGSAGASDPKAALPGADTIVGKTGAISQTSYSAAAANATMNQTMIGMAGGNIPHTNLQPLLVVNFCIAINGIFPSRN